MKVHVLRRRFMKFVKRSAAVVVAAAATVGFLAASSGSALAAGVPYNDPDAVGTIGLCAQNGTPLTHGSVDDQPFVWKAIDSTAAAAPYNAPGASATLYAYQPRQDVDPRQWGGAQLSAASKFTNPAHPTAVMTGLDESLAGFLGAYSAQWDGLIQLRIFLGAPNQPIYSAKYDAATIKVSGNKWSLVSGDPNVACGSGSAVSLEQVLATDSAAAASLTAQTTQKPTQSAATGAAGATPSGDQTSSASAGASGSGQAPPTSAETAPPGSSGAPATESPAASSAAASGGHGGSSSHTLLFVLVIIAVIGAGFVGIQWLRSKA
jgi:hypothetical protein